MKYEKPAHFKKDFGEVDLGVDFLNDKSCREIIIFYQIQQLEKILRNV